MTDPLKPTFDVKAYRDAPSGDGPLAAEWKDKPHRLVYDLVEEVVALRRLLWIRHDNHFGALYGDDGEMQCGACGLDFKLMSAKDLSDFWTAHNIKKLQELMPGLEELVGKSALTANLFGPGEEDDDY